MRHKVVQPLSCRSSWFNVYVEGQLGSVGAHMLRCCMRAAQKRTRACWMAISLALVYSLKALGMPSEVSDLGALALGGQDRGVAEERCVAGRAHSNRTRILQFRSELEPAQGVA